MTPRERQKVIAAQRRIILASRGPLLRAERRYVNDLRAVFKGIHRVYEDYLQRAIEDTAAKGDAGDKPSKKPSGKAKEDVRRLRASVEKQIPKKVIPLFDVMAGEVRRASDAVAKKMLPIGLKDAGVDKIVKEQQALNVQLVVDANRAYSDQVVQLFTDPNNYGVRNEVLAKELFKRGDVSQSRAELIARDQTLKTNAAIASAKQTSAGITKYIWSTSKDERVRGNPDGKWPDAEISHYDLEGKIFDWDDPPEPGHPGEDYQCRCIAIPYIESIADIEFDY